jgi:hypothetical protein
VLLETRQQRLVAMVAAREGSQRDGRREPAVAPVPRPRAIPVLHLLLESVVHDGSTGELALSFYPLGITIMASSAAMIGQPAEVAA